MSTLAHICLALVLVVAPLHAGDGFAVTTPGKPGSGGLVPALDGTGGLTPGSTNNTALLTDAAPNRNATLVPGPAPDKLVFGFGTDATGALVLPVMPPAELPPGFAVFAQFWIDDPGASAGLSASNTLAITVQAATSSALLYPVAIHATGMQPWAIAVGDLDNDGLPDVCLTNLVAAEVTE